MNIVSTDKTNYLKKKIRAFSMALVWSMVFTFTLLSQAEGLTLSTHITDAFGTTTSSSFFTTPISISVSIDPSITNWVAWHDRTAATSVAGVDYVGSYSWIGVDDFFNLTITNPQGATLTNQMDYNNAMALSWGQQAVIFGDAASTPDVARWGAPWSSPRAGTPSNPLIFDEAGIFNSIFTAAGTYDFTFRWGNSGSNTIGAPSMYLLVDQRFQPVPEPNTLLLLGFGLAGLAGIRWKMNSRRS